MHKKYTIVCAAEDCLQRFALPISFATPAPRRHHKTTTALEQAIGSRAECCNNKRYYETLADVTAYDVYLGQHLEIIQYTKEVKTETLKAGRVYNSTVRGTELWCTGCSFCQGSDVPLSQTTYN